MTKSEILNKVNSLPYEDARSPFKILATKSVIVYNSKFAFGFWNIKDKGHIRNCVCQVFPKYNYMEIEGIQEDLSNLGKELKWFDESKYYNEYGGLLLAIKELNKNEL